ncbi:MAG: acyl-CoA synthetase [Proteobacteria bacterium]|nr:acyl-CoA synthetase [Pseudomonadota bacterium]MDA0862590.1 acyl-CoA synthetase [Pseudomonadota bacterium]MDA1031499.1 acyl-CoA synthetase [Pseudomonadota bacterium]
MHEPFNLELEKNPGNYSPLSPTSLIAWASDVYPERVAVVYGERKQTWRETYTRCRQFASALEQIGVGYGDTVAIMAPNIPAMFEAHYGIPMLGAVINALNTRLDATTIAFMLEHGGAKVLLVDREYRAVINEALEKLTKKPYLIDIMDPSLPDLDPIAEVEYEAFIVSGEGDFEVSLPNDEWDAIALSYTSGTTGDPKGVVTHHRGAYLNAVGNVVTWTMPYFSTYLWTLPMFHCNGWCFPWTLAAVAGTSICLRRVEADAIFSLIQAHGVTHMCGAPVVYNTLINAPKTEAQLFSSRVKGMIAGAAPPRSVIEGAEVLGIDLTHVYGLTEVYGPAAVCAQHPEWEQLSLEQRAEKNGRQGVRYVVQEGMEVLDSQTMLPVPRDGKTMGEICFRGNITMKGYLKNPSATNAAFEGGWFRTGDLAIIDEFGYVTIRDRSKDIIISGGENISTIEIEDALYEDHRILEAAVVAQRDEKWGEVPCAFVTLKSNDMVMTESEVIEFCKERLARYKCPKRVIFGALPKTSTGKIQKAQLREFLADSK